MASANAYDPAAVARLVDAAAAVVDQLDNLAISGLVDDEGPIDVSHVGVVHDRGDLREALHDVDPTGLITQNVRRQALGGAPCGS